MRACKNIFFSVRLNFPSLSDSKYLGIIVNLFCIVHTININFIKLKITLLKSTELEYKELKFTVELVINKNESNLNDKFISSVNKDLNNNNFVIMKTLTFISIINICLRAINSMYQNP